MVFKCPICFEPKLCVVTNCGHSYCIDCVEKINECSICRERIAHVVSNFAYNQEIVKYLDKDTETNHPTSLNITNRVTLLNKRFKNDQKSDDSIEDITLIPLPIHTNHIRIVPKFKISNELCAFMGLEPGSKASRSNALSCVSRYVKENGLNGIEVIDANGEKKLDKRLINLDDNLANIFPNLRDSNEHLAFTNILKHVNQHFPPHLNNN